MPFYFCLPENADNELQNSLNACMALCSILSDKGKPTQLCEQLKGKGITIYHFYKNNIEIKNTGCNNQFIPIEDEKI